MFHTSSYKFSNATLSSVNIGYASLHCNSQSVGSYTNDDVSFYNMFANYFVSKIDSFKAAITSQLLLFDPVCSLPSLQLLEPVISLEDSKLLSIIPPKSCLDYIPILPSLNSTLLYYLTSLLTWLICPSVRALFRPSLSTLLSLHF